MLAHRPGMTLNDDPAALLPQDRFAIPQSGCYEEAHVDTAHHRH
ncbi:MULTISPECIES: hypothetical protein [unclassified Bradyrhizobium]|nr:MULTISPECIES: hypothetical protein [unclassified Bradyrhizobium]